MSTLAFLGYLLGIWSVPFTFGWLFGSRVPDDLRRELMRARQLLFENRIDYAPDEGGLKKALTLEKKRGIRDEIVSAADGLLAKWKLQAAGQSMAGGHQGSEPRPAIAVPPKGPRGALIYGTTATTRPAPTSPPPPRAP